MTLVLLTVAVVLVAALVAVNVAYIRHLEAKDRRHDEQVARLCQRLQAPELAIHEHAAMGPAQMPSAVDSTDDEDYWKAQEEAIERIQTLEREGL